MKKLLLLSFYFTVISVISAQVPQLTSPENYSRYVSASRVELVWVDDPTINLYRVEVALNKSFDAGSLVYTFNPFNNKQVITNLSYETNYYWRVRDELVPNTWSEIWTFRTTGSPVPPVIGSPANNSKNVPDSLLYVWSEDSVNVSFIFQLSNNLNFTNIIIQATSELNQYKVKNLAFETEYFARVKSYNIDNEESAWSNIIKVRTALPTPNLITPQYLSRVEPYDVEFSWQGGGTATSYIFQLGYDTLLTKLIHQEILQRSRITLDEVDFDTTFYWRVRSFNGVGDSSGWAASRKFRSKPIITFSPKVLNDTINYSEKPIDYLDKLYLTNSMEKLYVIEKIFIQPDSIFIPDKYELTLPPQAKDSIGIDVDTSKVKLGINKGKLYLVKGLYTDDPDTTAIEINLMIEKAKAVIQTKKVEFDTTKSGQKSYKDIFIRNQGGNIPLEIDSLFFTGIDTAAFHVSGYDKMIYPENIGRVIVEFDPQKLGSHTSVIHILTNSFPVDSFTVPLSGIGKGGLISPVSVSQINSFADSLFETFRHNNLKFSIQNSGNYPLKFSFGFVENYFKISKEQENNFTLLPGAKKDFTLQYLTPDFDTLNVDTLKVYHDGLGESPINVALQGTFDSLYSTALLRESIVINGEKLAAKDYVIPENNAVQIWLGEKLIDDFDNLDFRVVYFKGGPGKRIFAVDAGNNRYIIPYTDISANGLIFGGEIIARSPNNSIVDSMTVFNFLDLQVLVENFTTKSIELPYSKPAENAENASVKWVMFGFPFDDVYVDSVFSAFGGLANMDDGEWIIYDYDSSAEGSFIRFNQNTFPKHKAFFAAQSLRDSYSIFYKYENMIQTRKLTDTVMTLSGNGWKTISNPYTFDVEVDSSVTLRKYDPYNKSYKFTNIMRPGEGYFVEPEVEKITMKTFGEYYPSLFPKIFSAVGWHLDLKFENENYSKNILMSVDRGGRLSKSSNMSERKFVSAPQISEGLNCCIIDEDGQTALDAGVLEGKDGAVWDIFLVNELKNDYVRISPAIIGDIPRDMKLEIYDCSLDKSYTGEQIEISLYKGLPKKIKVLVGTDNFIADEIAQLNENIPENFTLYQNYPNPFNPVTVIKYYIPEDAVTKIQIFDILGREVENVYQGFASKGMHEISFSAQNLASGVYFYRVEVFSAADAERAVSSEIKKMILLK